MKKSKLILAVFSALLILGISGCNHDSENNHEHTFSEEWTSDATYHWHEATCGHTDETDGMAEHTFDDGKITKESTEDAEGEKTFTCTVCGYTKTETVEKLAHTHKFSDEWTSDETNHWHTSTCGHTNEVSGKTGHTWNDGVVITAPTETAEGVKTFTCTVCGKTKTESVTRLNHTHNHSDSWTTDDANHWHVCSGCTVLKDNTAHTWNDGEVTATCTEDGEKTYTCTVCGKTKTEPVAALGHTWDSGTLKDNPTSFAPGNYKYTCTVCGVTKNEPLVLTGIEINSAPAKTYYKKMKPLIQQGLQLQLPIQMR